MFLCLSQFFSGKTEFFLGQGEYLVIFLVGLNIAISGNVLHRYIIIICPINTKFPRKSLPLLQKIKEKTLFHAATHGYYRSE